MIERLHILKDELWDALGHKGFLKVTHPPHAMGVFVSDAPRRGILFKGHDDVIAHQENGLLIFSLRDHFLRACLAQLLGEQVMTPVDPREVSFACSLFLLDDEMDEHLEKQLRQLSALALRERRASDVLPAGWTFVKKTSKTIDN